MVAEGGSNFYAKRFTYIRKFIIEKSPSLSLIIVLVALYLTNFW